MKNFKRFALLLLASLIISTSASAKILSFGVKAGLNVNKLHFSKEAIKDLTTASNSTGWEAGVMAEANIPIIGLGFDVSLMYARMNNNASQAYFPTSDPNVFNAFTGKEAGKNFLMIPVNIKYKFNLPVVSKYLVPFLFTGPDFAFKLDKNIVNSVKSKTCQVAWNVGLGLEFFSHLQIAGSYGFGINNIADKFKLVNATDLNIKNNYWTVTAAWLF